MDNLITNENLMAVLLVAKIANELLSIYIKYKKIHQHS